MAKENFVELNQISASLESVVITVENDTPINIKLQFILEEGEHVSVKTESRPLPIWFDRKKFKRGQQFFKKNYFAMFVSKLSGLLMVLSVPSILKVLILTGKSSEPGKAFRRYMDTISNMLDWYNGDITDSEDNIHKILMKVRGQHCAASRKSVCAGNNFVSQKDMALTQFGFMGICLCKASYLGIKGNEEETDGFIHFWRTIGYFMGMDDRFNICSGTTAEVLQICEKIRLEVYKPFMESPPSEFSHMATTLLKGVRPIVPFLNPEAFLEFTRQLLDIESNQPLVKAYARIILRIQIFVHNVILSVWILAMIFKPILNFHMWLSLFLNIRFPYLASLTLGNDVYPEKELSTVNQNNKQNLRLVGA